MKKSNIILIILIVILTIALIIVTHSYFILREHAKTSFDSALSNADLLYEANKRVQELEEELEQYKNPSITTNVMNTVNTNKVTSTEPYIPDGMQVADLNDNSGIKASDVKIEYDINKVKIEVLKNTVTNTYAEILITDNNENNGGWGKSYRIQKKENNKWIDLKPIQNLGFKEIAFLLDENNQLKQKIDWKEFYGELDKGTYRIVKPIYNNGYIDLYSDEFEIK